MIFNNVIYIQDPKLVIIAAILRLRSSLQLVDIVASWTESRFPLVHHVFASDPSHDIKLHRFLVGFGLIRLKVLHHLLVYSSLHFQLCRCHESLQENAGNSQLSTYKVVS
jgi:hypothetical protein